MKRVYLLVLLILSLIVTGCSSSTGAGADEIESFPEEPIEVILPFPTGSNYDGAARILFKHAEKYLPTDQTFALINKTGGANTAGVTELQNTKPDGYTLGFVQTSTITTEPHYGHVNYSHDSFQPIMKILQVDGYMFIREDAPWQSFDEWLEFMKENPGEFAVSAVPGAVPALESLKVKADIEFDIVPFDGFSEATTALVGGHVDGTIATLPGMRPQMEAGKVKPFFSTSGGDISADVPKLSEKDINLVENKMVGLFAPKEISEEKLTLLHDVFKETTEDPEFQEEFENAGYELAYSGPEEFQEDITETFEFDKQILKDAGLIE